MARSKAQAVDAGKLIPVTCESTDLIDPKKLTPLQGDLKWLEDKQYEKLKASFLRHGMNGADLMRMLLAGYRRGGELK